MTTEPDAQALKQELEKIKDYINQAKHEIAGLTYQGTTESEKKIEAAATQLAEVIKHTEEATNAIMDHAEAILGIAGELGDQGATLSNHGLAILEACSFQDITGQRINKVLKTFEQIELRVNNLIKLFWNDESEVVGYTPTATPVSARPDEHLMEGPQLDKDKPSQDDIDKLFNAS